MDYLNYMEHLSDYTKEELQILLKSIKFKILELTQQIKHIKELEKLSYNASYSFYGKYALDMNNQYLDKLKKEYKEISKIVK